jgi:glutamine amidotransferase
MSEKRPLVVVMDYGVGNVASVVNMFQHVGAECVPSGDPDMVASAPRVVLPGVGAFDAAIDALRASSLDVALKQALRNGAYALGICLGAQLLMERSEEGQSRGLGLIPGVVRRFQTEVQGLRVPHMGWNIVHPRPGSLLFDVSETQRYYFAHSYYLDCTDDRHVAAVCRYGSDFACAIQHDRVFGAQFHPEKSHRFGKAFFQRFADLPC